MKKPKDGEAYFFGDESGDPTFYDRYGKCIVGEFGCSQILILGFIETRNPSAVRRAILDLHAKVTEDPILKRFPSARKTAIAFHAKDDRPEVQYLFFSLIRQLEFKAQMIVARKIEQVFRERYRGKENKFYDDLVTGLFENVLHRFNHNEITLAARGSSSRRKPLERAIWRAKGRFERRHNVDRNLTTFKMQFHRLSGEPCLSIIDYMNWAVYRAVVNGDDRYYDSVKSKISVMMTRGMPGLKHFYTRKNPFDVQESAPLGLGS